MRQREVFALSEGDGCYRRNRVTPDVLEGRAADDPVLKLLDELSPAFRKTLEIGASNGWRLECLRRRVPDGSYAGVDPSKEAVAL